MKFVSVNGDFMFAFCNTCPAPSKVLYDSMEGNRDAADLEEVLDIVKQHKLANPDHHVEITIDSTWEPVVVEEKKR